METNNALNDMGAGNWADGSAGHAIAGYPAPAKVSYRDAYATVRSIGQISMLVKILAIIVATASFLAVFDSLGGTFGGGAAYMVSLMSASVLGIIIYSWGVILPGFSYLVQSSLDTAVSVSPVLTAQDRAATINAQQPSARNSEGVC